MPHTDLERLRQLLQSGQHRVSRGAHIDVLTTGLLNDTHIRLARSQARLEALRHMLGEWTAGDHR